MNTARKSKYILLVIGDKQARLYFNNYAIAADCQLRYQERGQVALLMRYDPEKDDYTIAV